MRIVRLSLPVWVALLVCPLTARAQLLLTFTPDTETTFQDSAVGFSGTLTNIGNSEVFLNGDNVNFVGSGFTLDDSPFILNAPQVLTAAGTADSSYSGLLLNVATGMVTPGLYFGSFVVIGGATDFSSDTVAAQTFAVDVLPIAVPEPGAYALLGSLGLTGAAFLQRKRARDFDFASGCTEPEATARM